MKQANRIILIAVAAIAVLTVPATSFAKSPSVFVQGSQCDTTSFNHSAHGRHPTHAASIPAKSDRDSHF